jgi:hypothetical protein
VFASVSRAGFAGFLNFPIVKNSLENAIQNGWFNLSLESAKWYAVDGQGKRGKLVFEVGTAFAGKKIILKEIPGFLSSENSL